MKHTPSATLHSVKCKIKQINLQHHICKIQQTTFSVLINFHDVHDVGEQYKIVTRLMKYKTIHYLHVVYNNRKSSKHSVDTFNMGIHTLIGKKV
jgi:hypothetical protein